MSIPKAPSMPTDRQIERAAELARRFHPDARIRVIGPNGIEFMYPDIPTTGAPQAGAGGMSGFTDGRDR